MVPLIRLRSHRDRQQMDAVGRRPRRHPNGLGEKQALPEVVQFHYVCAPQQPGTLDVTTLRVEKKRQKKCPLGSGQNLFSWRRIEETCASCCNAQAPSNDAS
jgi:hypothetical protein